MTAPLPLSRDRVDAPRLKSWRQAVVLSLMAGHGAPVSPKALAEMSGATLSATSHHVRGLFAAGLLDQVAQRRVGGVYETFYVVNERGQHALRRPRIEALLVLSGGVGRGSQGGEAAIGEIDEQGWHQLAELGDRVGPQVGAILQAAAARRAPRRRRPDPGVG